MRKIIMLVLFAGITYLGFSQTVTVKDEKSGKPLGFVSLISEDFKTYAMTNTKGQVDILEFKDQEIIEIRCLGYATIYTSYNGIRSMGDEIFLNEITFEIDALVISASKWNQHSSDIPSKVTTISSREISLQNPQTAADLLSVSGEVFVQKSQQGGGSPMVRGFATNRLLYIIDGVRMNTAIFRSGNIQNVISLDPYAIENTEILFGPGSIMYGSDAIGGVMNFKTLTPQLSADSTVIIAGNAAVRYSSANNERTGHFDVAVIGKKMAMLTSISSNNFDDLRMGSFGPDEYLRPFYVQRQDSVDVVVTNDDPKVQRPSGYSQMNLMQKFRFKPHEKWDLQYGFHYSETSEYSRCDRHIRYNNGVPRYGEWFYGPQKWMMNNLSVSHQGNNMLYDQMSLIMAQQYFEESRISRDINKSTRETKVEAVDAYSVNLDLTKKVGQKNKIFYGIESVWNNVSSTGLDEDISTGEQKAGASRYPQATWASYGVYVNDVYSLSDKLSLQGGIRYNQFTLDATFDTTFYPFPFTKANINNGALTGSLGTVFIPSDKWIVSTNFGTSFRSPNVDDVGKVFDSEPGSVVVPNPDLNAEYAYNIDLSITKMFGDFMKFDITGFYTILQNALVRRDFTLNGNDSILYAGTMSKVQAVQNAAIATVYGFNTGVEIKLPAGFGISSDFNYQYGEEELDDGTLSPSRHAAPWFGVSKLNYRHDNLTLQFYASYSGEKSYDDLPDSEKGKDYIYAIDENGNPYSPAWYTINFKAIYNITNFLTVSAGVENITDQRYRPYSSGIAAAGRNYVISLRTTF